MDKLIPELKKRKKHGLLRPDDSSVPGDSSFIAFEEPDQRCDTEWARFAHSSFPKTEPNVSTLEQSHNTNSKQRKDWSTAVCIMFQAIFMQLEHFSLHAG